MSDKKQKAYQFLASLEAETEEIMTERMYAVKEAEQHIRELEFAIAEVRKKSDPNIELFSPVGGREKGSSEQLLRKEAEEWKEKIPGLQERVEEQRQKKSEIENLKKIMENYEKVQKNEAVSLEDAMKYRLLETQELDRNRIARDLHDSTVQNMTMIVHKAELCVKMLDKDPVRVRLELQSMIENIKASINDMREIIYDLRPMSLNNLGLAATLESYAAHMQRNNDIQTEFQVVGTEPELLPIVKVTLYRIVQEACNNAVKHAKASTIRIVLTFNKQEMELTVSDDGIGFDKNQIIRNEEDSLHGFGLSTMKERAGLLTGKFEIESEPAKGTTIRVKVPFRPEKEEVDE